MAQIKSSLDEAALVSQSLSQTGSSAGNLRQVSKAGNTNVSVNEAFYSLYESAVSTFGSYQGIAGRDAQAVQSFATKLNALDQTLGSKNRQGR